MASSYLIPNSTQIPDLILDRWMGRLSGAEIKVVLYVARRTFGFRRDSDTISLAQMAKGIVTRDGRQLDCGTGLNKDTVAKTVQALIEKGILIRTRHTDERGGDAPSTYSLNLDSEFGLGDGEAKTPVPRVGKSDTPSRGGEGAIKPDTTLSENPTPPRGQNPTPPVSGNPTHNIQLNRQTVRQTDNNKQCAGAKTHADVVVSNSNQESEDVVAALIAAGISPDSARHLVSEQGAECCQRQLTRLPYRRADNRAAVLRRAIEGDWAPDESQTKAEEQARQTAERQRRSAEQKAREDERRAAREAERARLEAIWQNLSDTDRETLEDEAWRRAMENAAPPVRGVLERASKSQEPPTPMVRALLENARVTLLTERSR